MAEGHIPAALRRKVEERARSLCEYCHAQQRYSAQSFSVEHILPRARGGEMDLDNLAFSCQGCNNAKYTKTSALDSLTGEVVALYHPRRQRWPEHFAWNQDYSLLIGLTPAGRATIAALRLNREGLVNLRRALYALGEHPPADP